MRRYWLLGWDRYYPDGGLNNVLDTYATIEEAEAALEACKQGNPPNRLYRRDHYEIEDVYHYLY